MENGIDKSFHALIESENFQFWRYHMDTLTLNTNNQFYVDLTNFQNQIIYTLTVHVSV